MNKITFILIFFVSTFKSWANLQFHTILPKRELFASGVVDIVQDANGFMWIVKGDDVQRYDGYKFKSYFNRIEQKESSPFRSIVCTSKGNIYVANSNSIFKYKANVDSFVCVYNTLVRRLSFDKNDNIWIYGNEVGYYSTSLKKYIPLLVNGKSVQGKVFASPYSNTFILTNESKLLSITNDGSVDSLDIPKNISSLAWMSAHSTNLYLLSENGEIYKINLRTQKGEFVDVKYNKSINAKCLHIAPNHNLWIGTMQGLYVYNPTTNNTQHFQNSLKSNSLVNNSVWTIYQDQSANIWLGTFSGAISVVYAIDNGAIIKIKPQDFGYAIPAIRALALDEKSNSLWFGTEGSGLFKIINIEDSNKISIDQTLSFPTNIKSLYLDNDNLWIGSYLGGLQCFNTNTLSLTSYNHLLLDNQIKYFYIDTNKNIWIIYQSNNKIVTKFDIKQLTSEHLTIDSEEAKPSILYGKLQNSITSLYGKTYRATIDGIYVIDSLKIIKNNNLPNVLISNIRIKGKEHPFNTEILLKHNDYYLEIELASSNMIYPENNVFSYRLSNFNLPNRSEEWYILPDNNRVITFPHLAAGNYILEVNTANNDGIWGKPIELKIIVKPIFWASNWAVLIYLTLLIILSILINHIISSRRKLQNEVYLAQQRQLDSERMNKGKVRFFANVKSEFSLPLQKMLNSTDDNTINKSIQEMIHTINRYTEEYCIDTSKTPSLNKLERDLDTFRELVATGIEKGEKIDIDELAYEMGMSRRKLYDFVKNNFGKSIVQYIRSYRLSLAVKYMVEEEISIKEAMNKVGFDSISYFTKAFKEEYGETPAAFIEKLKKQKMS